MRSWKYLSTAVSSVGTEIASASARCRLELDNIGAVRFRAIDHDAVLTVVRRPLSSASRFTATRAAMS
jgi:hypothetical protein